MGGSTLGQMFGQLQAPEYQNQDFSADQIMQYAKGGYGTDMANAYKAEVLNQLRNGSFKDANGVYAAMMNGNARQQQMDAYNQQQEQQLAEQQAAQGDQGGYYQG